MRLGFRVTGRPAPQGSHELGANGYVMHSSKYLANWRAEVNRACREAYVEAGLTGADMPLIAYPRPVTLAIVHIVQDDQCGAEGTGEPTGTPDLDKLARATIDGLGEARAFKNDSQVVTLVTTKRRPCHPNERPGAVITITDEFEQGETTTVAFTPNGRFRLVLEEIGTNEDGDRTWETVVEASDTAERLLANWLPAIAGTLGDQPAPVTAPSTAADEPAKPRRGRKAAPPPVVVETPPAAAPVAPVPPVPAPPVEQAAPAVPEPQAPAQPAEAPPARVNPFARG